MAKIKKKNYQINSEVDPEIAHCQISGFGVVN